MPSKIFFWALDVQLQLGVSLPVGPLPDDEKGDTLLPYFGNRASYRFWPEIQAAAGQFVTSDVSPVLGDFSLTLIGEERGASGSAEVQSTEKNFEKNFHTLPDGTKLNKSDLIMHIHLFTGHGKLKKIRFQLGLMDYVSSFSDSFIDNVVSCCKSCDLFNTTKKVKLPLASYPLCTKPLERVSMDLCKLNATVDGYNYILVIIDHYYRFVAAEPLENKNSTTVFPHIIQFIHNYGQPVEFNNDGGQEFLADVTIQQLRSLGIMVHHHTPRRHQANGMVERVIGTIQHILRRFMHDDNKQQCWVRYLRKAVEAYNGSFHSSIKNIPDLLFLGRLRNNPFVVSSLPYQRRQTVGAQFLAASHRKHNYDKTVSCPFQFQVGDKVWRLLDNNRDDLASVWEDSVLTIELVNDTHALCSDGVHVKPIKVHLDQLRPATDAYVFDTPMSYGQTPTVLHHSSLAVPMLGVNFYSKWLMDMPWYDSGSPYVLRLIEILSKGRGKKFKTEMSTHFMFWFKFRQSSSFDCCLEDGMASPWSAALRSAVRSQMCFASAQTRESGVRRALKFGLCADFRDKTLD
eukprot:Pgem_evm1s19228